MKWSVGRKELVTSNSVSNNCFIPYHKNQDEIKLSITIIALSIILV